MLYRHGLSVPIVMFILMLGCSIPRPLPNITIEIDVPASHKSKSTEHEDADSEKEVGEPVSPNARSP